MKCALDYDKILAYRLGELAGREAEEVEHHIASCPRCAQELAATDGLLEGLAKLPVMEPGAERWTELRGAIEREWQPGMIRLLSALARGLRRPVVAAAVLLLVCALGGYVFMRRESAPTRTEIAVEEMGSTIARTRPAERGFDDALDSYLDDSRLLVAGVLRCTASGDAGCWRGLTARIAENEMLYRGIWLSERLSRPSDQPRREGVRMRALVDDSLGLFRAISEQSPERLAGAGDSFAKEIDRMDLFNRLKEGRSR